MLDTAERLPWAGHTARHALGEIYELIKRHTMTLDLRQHAQPGRDDLPAALGDERRQSRDRAASRLARCRRSAAASRTRWRPGKLRAVVATSSLDLGIDWGDVDLVINVGAPKGASRLLQRIGRANHRMDEPSKGVLVPANRFEVLECTRRDRGGRRECAGHAAVAHRRARRAGAARARLRLRRAVPRRRSLSRGDDRRALRGADARRLRRHDRFRRDRRLRAEILRALRQDQADAGRHAGASRTRASRRCTA